MPSVYVKTLGCKVNTFDSHALENQFRDHGFDMVSQVEPADVTVVNTCSVTANATKEARYLARRYKRDNPRTLLIFTGCYAQTDSAAIAELPEVDFVVPNEVREQVVDMAQKGLLTASRPSEPEAKFPDGVEGVRDNRGGHFKSSVTYFDRADSRMTRAFLKIQDGCNGFCSYCLIPYARGQSRSVPPERVLSEVRRLADRGVPEIVLTGIHIGDYGRDLDGPAGDHAYPIVPLLEQMLAIAGVNRLRISSLEPTELSEPLVDLLAEFSHAVCDHFHLPLQSGNDRILKRMRRAYDREEYRRGVERVRRAFPEANIGADVIPGFPGETEDEHCETMDFIRDLGLAYLHVFPYSRRPNTAAARLPDPVDRAVVKRRAAELRSLSRELADGYARGFLGRPQDVLWEQDTDDKGRRLGHTPNYLTVVAGDPHEAPEPGTVSRWTPRGFVNKARLLATPSPLEEPRATRPADRERARC